MAISLAILFNKSLAEEANESWVKTEISPIEKESIDIDKIVSHIMENKLTVCRSF